LCALTGLDDRVIIHHASALDMPFEDESFDGAYSMNVSMNIADRDGLYREIHRVLRPGAWLVLSELAQGPNTGELNFPVPLAATAEESFLTTPGRTCELLEACGPTVSECSDSTEAQQLVPIEIHCTRNT
jgi:ubiquinone/menaquinone biosynthesis C-methylase UbiE